MDYEAELLPGTLDLLILKAVSIGPLHGYGVLLRIAQISEHALEEELRSHIQLRADDLERFGLGRAEAERRARIEFGGPERFKEECRDELAGNFIDVLFQDLRFGLRMLRKSPGFAAVVILTVALGIGATTAIFSVVDATLLSPLPYLQPERLVSIQADLPGLGARDVGDRKSVV